VIAVTEVFATAALEETGVTNEPAAVTKVVNTFPEVIVTVAAELPTMEHAPPMSPSASSFNTQKSFAPAPKELVAPATAYPPSSVG